MCRVRLMPVGDSMTIGSAGDHTWRYRLWAHLREAAEPADLVGPRDALHEGSHHYAEPAFPTRARGHLAGWGEGWLHHKDVIADAVRTHRPDILLVSLGLIDLGFYTDAEQTARNARHFLTEARRADPAIRAVVLPVIPNVRAVTDAPFAAEVARFNTLLAALVAELTTPAAPLVLATPPADWDLARDTYDGTHPAAPGEHRLAAAFAAALHAAFALGAPYTAQAEPAPAVPA
ncbi:GDSL-type esterase/lipase family protein [Streptomyces sp. GSL17-111]|uniref:GDSL-type esterase/lipase family protein n=1 Tax=Streptomyces sp. GSL17-111 TaxID=3121596 RepID=UPI0030F432CD